MTSKVSITTAVAIAALTVGTTAAPGQGRYGGSHEPAASSGGEARSAVAFEHGRGRSFGRRVNRATVRLRGVGIAPIDSHRRSAGVRTLAR